MQVQQAQKNQQGFTLIETIAVLVLVGIVSVVLGLAIVQAAKTYVFARTNVSISQKAQLALARIDRELRSLTAIDPLNSGPACIRYKRETASRYFRTIGLHEGSLRMNAPAGIDADCPSAGNPGDILVDDVNAFSIGYEDGDGNMFAGPPGELADLRAVHIGITIGRADRTREENFSIVVNPRNNGLLNGPGESG